MPFTLDHPPRCAVVAPTYNNGTTLINVLDRIDAIGIHVIVVNDGSTDGTAALLEQWQVASPQIRNVMTHTRNLGKAAAMLTGFAEARKLNYTHAITIDTDDQLDPEEIPKFVAAVILNPHTLVLGSRDATSAAYPRLSRLGRWASNVLILWWAGLRVSDSQCGFRAYPLAEILQLPCLAGRYGYETEIVCRAGWAGLAVAEVSVNCHYVLPQGRVSHFRAWEDSWRAVGMHARLLARSLCPSRVKRFDMMAPTGTLFRRITSWFSPMRAWREARETEAGRTRFSVALATGILIGNTPLYGFHSGLSLLAARLFHLHPLTVVAGSHVSTPPLGPILVASAIALGHFILAGNWPTWSSFDPRTHGFANTAGRTLLEWTIGGVVIGVTLAMLAFVGMQIALRFFAGRHPVAPTT